MAAYGEAADTSESQVRAWIAVPGGCLSRNVREIAR